MDFTGFGPDKAGEMLLKQFCQWTKISNAIGISNEVVTFVIIPAESVFVTNVTSNNC